MLKMAFDFSCIRQSLLLICILAAATSSSNSGGGGTEISGGVVKRDDRTILVSTEYGEISAARVTDNINGSAYLLHFFSLDPNSLFLPVLLHADMIFYVHTGSGKLRWTEEGELKSTDIRRGDVYKLEEGAAFFLQSNLDTDRQKLRIHAFFSNSNKEELATGPYSSIRDMVLGFDKEVLQAAFMVPEKEIEELLNGKKAPPIIHGFSRMTLDIEGQFIGRFLGGRTYSLLESNRKRRKGGARLFNLFKEDKDFENGNGWSTTVTRKKLSALKGADVGVFMVNLTTGSMMGPHWNPMATEIGIVLQGRGMVRVICSNETRCRNTRYEVEEGDIFVVPRFHTMAQMAFNNQTLVFMGFSTSSKRNHPQFLAGQASVFRILDKDVVVTSFNITATTMDQLLASQQGSIILGCISCAEEELRIMEEETEKEKEAAREKEEEETRKKEEEERWRREEEARREEEERRKREEAAAARKREEDARKREEEEARRQEEERRKREEVEEDEAAKRREEEEEESRKEKEEKARRQEEDRRRRRRRGGEEEEATRKEEEEKARRQEEERRRGEEEPARRREEEEEAREDEEEELRMRKEEAAARRGEAEEERKRQEEEAAAAARRREEEVAIREEERRMRQEEEEEEIARRREKPEERKRRKEG